MSDQKPCYEIGRFSINCNAQGTDKCRHSTVNAAPGPVNPQGAPVATSATNATDRFKVTSEAASKLSKWNHPVFSQAQEKRPDATRMRRIK